MTWEEGAFYAVSNKILHLDESSSGILTLSCGTNT